jgi:hypothetical protein
MIKDKFEIELLDEARDFLWSIDEKARIKLFFIIDKSKKYNDPATFKKLDNDICEFRTKYKNLQHRLLAFWNKRNNRNTLVVALTGLLRKLIRFQNRRLRKQEL